MQPEEKKEKPGSGERRNFVLRLDARKLAALEKWAADDFRSVNGQLEWLITQALFAHKRWPPANQEKE
jgi:hypothetical protein